MRQRDLLLLGPDTSGGIADAAAVFTAAEDGPGISRIAARRRRRSFQNPRQFLRQHHILAMNYSRCTGADIREELGRAGLVAGEMVCQRRAKQNLGPLYLQVRVIVEE